MYDRNSRYERYEKQRKNTKLITFLGIIGGLLALMLIALFVLPFGDNQTQDTPDEKEAAEQDGDTSGEQNDQDTTSDDDRTSSDQDEGTSGSTNEENESAENNDDSQNDTETTQESNDPNVIETIRKDWEPIGTEQEGNHVTTYDTESQDWKEMEEAVRYGAGLSDEKNILWRIENGGSPQKAIGTITNGDQSEIYRVYIQWVDQKGWKPTKVEVLNENDKKDLYENNDDEEQQDEEQ